MKSFKPNDDFVYYLYWIAERMNVFWNKAGGKTPPYTKDKILQDHKFTNVYRSLDRSSQYLLNNVIGSEHNQKQFTKEDMFWRIFIYKHFNLPSTWDLICELTEDFKDPKDLEEIGHYLRDYQEEGRKLYSNAYMMTTAFLSGDTGQYSYLKKLDWRKHQFYFHIFEEELMKGDKLKPILEAESMEELHNSIKNITSFGDFTAYQIAQDLNYTDHWNFDDNEFCAAGPGTIRGIQRTFDIEGKPDYPKIIKWVQNNFSELMEEYGIPFKGLPNWTPKVPDLSNCFCETDKYLRGLGGGKTEVAGKRIKQVFKENKESIKFVFPQKWGVKL